MTQTLNAILKTKFLTNSSIPASRAFSQTVADLLSDDASISDAINLAQAVYLQATGTASMLPQYAIPKSAIALNIRGFSDPYARQSVSDFSYLLSEVIANNPLAQEQYQKFRRTALLQEEFLRYLPIPKQSREEFAAA